MSQRDRDFLNSWMAKELPEIVNDIERFREQPRNARNSPNYTETETWGLACFWLRRCAELELPPPMDLVNVVFNLAGKPAFPKGEWSDARDCSPRNAGAWHKAVALEVRSKPDPEGKMPSQESVSKLSKHAGVSRSTIRRWREKPAYQEIVALARMDPSR